jgi:hypothetical protein
MKRRHTVPRPVLYDNAPYGNTTSVFHMAICHTIPWLVPFTWQCVIQYHDQCLSPGNMSYSNTTSAIWKGAIRYHDQCYMTMRHTVKQPVYFTWQYVIRYHDQCLLPCNVSYGTTTSAFHMAQRLIFLTGCSFSVTWESSVIFCGYAFERRHWKQNKKNQKTKLEIYTKRENVIGANRRHFYQVVSV